MRSLARWVPGPGRRRRSAKGEGSPVQPRGQRRLAGGASRQRPRAGARGAELRHGSLTGAEPSPAARPSPEGSAGRPNEQPRGGGDPALCLPAWGERRRPEPRAPVHPAPSLLPFLSSSGRPPTPRGSAAARAPRSADESAERARAREPRRRRRSRVEPPRVRAEPLTPRSASRARRCNVSPFPARRARARASADGGGRRGGAARGRRGGKDAQATPTRPGPAAVLRASGGGCAVRVRGEERGRAPSLCAKRLGGGGAAGRRSFRGSCRTD